jgi:hypothetical protein
VIGIHALASCLFTSFELGEREQEVTRILEMAQCGQEVTRTGGETFHQGNMTRITDDIGGDANRSNKLG